MYKSVDKIKETKRHADAVSQQSERMVRAHPCVDVVCIIEMFWGVCECASFQQLIAERAFFSLPSPLTIAVAHTCTRKKCPFVYTNSYAHTVRFTYLNWRCTHTRMYIFGNNVAQSKRNDCEWNEMNCHALKVLCNAICVSRKMMSMCWVISIVVVVGNFLVLFGMEFLHIVTKCLMVQSYFEMICTHMHWIHYEMERKVDISKDEWSKQ